MRFSYTSIIGGWVWVQNEIVVDPLSPEAEQPASAVAASAAVTSAAMVRLGVMLSLLVHGPRFAVRVGWSRLEPAH